MNILDNLREIRGCTRQLKSLARSKCLTDREFDRLTARIEQSLEKVMGADTQPKAPTFHVVNGGRQ